MLDDEIVTEEINRILRSSNTNKQIKMSKQKYDMFILLEQAYKSCIQETTREKYQFLHVFFLTCSLLKEILDK